MADEPKAPETPEVWIKAVLEQANTPERQAALKAASRTFHDEELGQLGKRNESVTRERDRFKKALELDADSLQALVKADNLLEWARGVAKSMGVAESVLKYAHTPEDVQEMVAEHQAGATPAEGKAIVPATSLDEQVKAVLAKLGVKGAEPPKPPERVPLMGAGGLGVPQTSALASYKEALRTGKKLPSAAEIDRATAERFGVS